MKKFLFSVLVTILAVIMLQPAMANDSIEGKIYSTDILAFVNGKPIDGYNIGGRTVIIAEDLEGYGFGVEYDDSIRTLTIESYFNRGYNDIAPITRGKVGEILGNIYKTDIKVYYNGIIIKGYNIGGRTAICLEDMGELTDSTNADYGYSQYLGRSIWDAEDRTISYESFIRNQDEILCVSRVYHRFKDNVIFTYPDEFYARSEFSALEDGTFKGMYTYSPGTGMSRYLIKPLYFDYFGELKNVGLVVANPNTDYDDAVIYIENPGYVKELICDYKIPQKSHDDALAYFKEVCNIKDQIENDSYTVLMAEHEEEGLIFVYINKQGGFVVDTFLSAYSVHDVKMWFAEADENYGPDTVVHSVYPFGGPHGTTTAQFVSELDSYDYE